VAQTADPDCEASINIVDNVDDPPGTPGDTIDDPPDDGDDTIDGGDASQLSQNCDDEGGTGNGGGNVETPQESEQDSESGEVDQDFDVS
jgi:hypothetical protein